MYHDFADREVEDVEGDNMRRDSLEAALLEVALNVRSINRAIRLNTHGGSSYGVYAIVGSEKHRIRAARTAKGVLQVRTLNGDTWVVPDRVVRA
ncbi:MAG: hypothetical protein H0W02_10285 [Ktedonobacteraceae bacterium]|nr:hypothetical protein [Ktedonobacteraceae bacterium]